MNILELDDVGTTQLFDLEELHPLYLSGFFLFYSSWIIIPCGYYKISKDLKKHEEKMSSRFKSLQRLKRITKQRNEPLRIYFLNYHV